MCWLWQAAAICRSAPVLALPLIRPPFTAPETHGDSGLGYARLPTSPVGPANEHAVDLIIREIMARPGEVTLVAVAPLTNVALAIRKEPRIVQAVREVIIMGAALRDDGNTTSLAEFNFFVDPHAAHIVLESGMPITLLPWDITKDVLLHQADVDRLLRIKSPVSRFIADATRFYMEFHEKCFGYSGCSINDPVAIALAFMPDLARTESMHVAVEYTSELTAGKSVITYIGDHQREPDAHDQLGYRCGALADAVGPAGAQQAKRARGGRIRYAALYRAVRGAHGAAGTHAAQRLGAAYACRAARRAIAYIECKDASGLRPSRSPSGASHAPEPPACDPCRVINPLAHAFVMPKICMYRCMLLAARRHVRQALGM